MGVLIVADLMNRALYGFYDANQIEQMSMQWHITTECDQRCKHCYMFESENYLEQKNNKLSIEESFLLVDEFYKLFKGFKTRGNIYLSGGDPILSPNFWDILDYIHRRYCDDIYVGILGNSFHIDTEVAKSLKNYGVSAYQISLDGLEDTHDYIRKKGSFKDALRALECLHNAGLITMVMFTINERNCKDALPLFKFINTLDFVDGFCIDRMIPVGNALVNSDIQPIDKEIYKRLLYDIYKYEVLCKPRTNLAKKDNLWKLFLNERGLTDPIRDTENTVCTGCVAGVQAFSVLADGSVYACRRLDIKSGKFPESSLIDIFFNSQLHKDIRDVNKYNECKNCNLLKYCRGCPAMKYAVNGDIYSPDPTCWRFR